MKRMPVIRLPVVLDEKHRRQRDEDAHHRDFQKDDRRGEIRRLLDADHENRSDDKDDEEPNVIEGELQRCTEECEDRLRHLRQSQSDVLEKRAQVAAPSDGNGRCTECVLQDQVPPDDPGDQFAQRRVGIRVGTARRSGSSKRTPRSRDPPARRRFQPAQTRSGLRVRQIARRPAR